MPELVGDIDLHCANSSSFYIHSGPTNHILGAMSRAPSRRQ